VGPPATSFLVGDAAHTAHFSIGSGTKIAMGRERPARRAARRRDTDVALAAYEARRRPEVEALQSGSAGQALECSRATNAIAAMPPHSSIQIG